MTTRNLVLDNKRIKAGYLYALNTPVWSIASSLKVSRPTVYKWLSDVTKDAKLAERVARMVQEKTAW